MNSEFLRRIFFFAIFLMGFGSTIAQDNCQNTIELLQSFENERLLQFDESNLYFTERFCNPIILKELHNRLNESNSEKLKIKVYRLLSLVSDYPKNVHFSDSVLKLVDNNSEHPLYAKQYYTKGVAYYNVEDPINSMRAFINGYKRAKRISDIVLTVNFLNAMGSVKGTYSKDYEAVLLNNQALKLMEQNEDAFGDDFVEQLLICIDNIAIHHLEYGDTDSSLYYVKRAQPFIEKSVDKESWKIDFNSLEGQINYYMGNYFKSKEILYEIDLEESNHDYSERLYYIGMSEGYLGNSKKKDSIFKIIYGLFDNKYAYTQNLGNVYQYLLERAIENEDKPFQKNLVKRKKIVDSIENSNEIKLQFLSSDDFSVSRLLNDKQVLQKEIKKKVYFTKVSLVLLIITVLALAIVIYRFRATKRRLKEVIRKGVVPKASNHKVNLIDERLEDVLNNLNSWESENGFLDNSITQQTLAKKLWTNDTYLSQVVNKYKNQSFPDYLKDLRITYLINDLRKNPSKVENKSQIQIAEMYGFNSVDVLRRVMHKKLNVSPAKFLKELKTSNL